MKRPNAVEGHNVTSVLRFAGGVPARLPELAAELVALKPDVILAGSVSGILAARTATRIIPLIFFVIEDPVAMGLVSSITRPGGNITGIWLFADDSLVGKRLEFLKHVVPGLVRIGVIINPDDSSDAIVLKRLPAAARAETKIQTILCYSFCFFGSSVLPWTIAPAC
jgi:ABC-type uncharacterized transport system substrate-binding protein